MVRPQRLQKHRAFYRLLVVVCLTVVLLVASPWVSAKESQQLKPQDWQINGILAALDDGYPGVKQKAFEKLVEFDAKDLAAFPKQSEEMAQKAISLFNDSKADSYLRIRAAEVLGKLGKADASIVQFLTNLFNNRRADTDLRISVAVALGNLDKTGGSEVQFLTNLVNDSKADSNLRFRAIKALGNLSKADASVVRFLMNLASDSNADSDLRFRAIEALGNLGKADVSEVQFLTNLANDSKAGSSLRSRAVDALGKLGETDGTVVQFLTNLANDSKADSYLRSRAVDALGNLKRLNLAEVFILIERTYDVRSDDLELPRFAAHFYGRGDSQNRTLLKWIGRPDSKSIPTQLTHAEAKATLEVFRDAWEPSQSFSNVRVDLAKAIADVAKMGKWETGDIALLEKHYKNLSDAKSNNADSVKAAIDSLTLWKQFNQFRNVITVHLLFWLTLIFAYPKFPQVQAIFFWNPWVRRILGVGYVGFLLTWVPFLRRKLFEPFKFSLLADSGVDRFNPAAYFPQSPKKQHPLAHRREDAL